MTLLRYVGEVIKDLVIGDDWRMTVGVVALLTLVAALASAGVPVWWIVPLGTAGLLVLGVVRPSG